MIRAPRTVHRSMRSAHLTIGLNLRINMNSYSSGRRSRRSRGGARHRDNQRFRGQQGKAKPQKKTFWQRVVAFFGDGTGTKKTAAGARNGPQPSRPPRKPETVEVTSPRLYVGNLSFDATESDLFELFNGVGHVQNAEVVSYRHNQRSKGFAFVQMQTIEEAKRAVEELHDKEFLGRRLVVSGAKSSEYQMRS
jgi:RNA recognition motif. (a.k.a. RRM, RBD, or RNP domain)